MSTILPVYLGLEAADMTWHPDTQSRRKRDQPQDDQTSRAEQAQPQPQPRLQTGGRTHRHSKASGVQVAGSRTAA